MSTSAAAMSLSAPLADMKVLRTKTSTGLEAICRREFMSESSCVTTTILKPLDLSRFAALTAAVASPHVVCRPSERRTITGSAPSRKPVKRSRTYCRPHEMHVRPWAARLLSTAALSWLRSACRGPAFRMPKISITLRLGSGQVLAPAMLGPKNEIIPIRLWRPALRGRIMFSYGSL